MSTSRRLGLNTKLTIRAPFKPLEESIQYEITHSTCYTYNTKKSSSVMSLCLKPREFEFQRVEDYSLQTTPSARLDEERDAFGNTRHLFDIHHPHQELTIRSNSTVTRIERNSKNEGLSSGHWDQLQAFGLDYQLWEFLQPSELTSTKEDLKEWTRNLGGVSFSDPMTFLDTLHRRLSETISYKPGRTTIDSTVEDVLLHREGVCQDISQLMIAIARSWGIPARYVSGYLYDQPGSRHHIAADSTHAWVDCLLPTLGWVSFDPTNPDGSESTRIVVAYGRDYRDVSPTKGITLGDGSTEMEVSVVVLKSMNMA